MRYISLLEFQPGLVADIMPPTSYLERTNGTLEAKNCRLHIDADGFMVSEKPLQADTDKVLLLGGSSIENLYIPADARILAQIETKCAALNRDVKVYNAGISNAHLLHLINLLLNKGIGLRPKYVVYYLTPGMDIVANERENAFWNPAPGLSPVRSGREGGPEFMSSYCNRNRFEDERRLLRTLHDVCRNFGMTLFICTWPMYPSYDEFMSRAQPNRAEYDGEQEQTAYINDVVRTACTDIGCELIDLAAAFKGLDHHRYFYDWNHPNVAGCAWIAEATTNALKNYL